MRNSLAFLLCVALMLAGAAAADVPHLINYQGVLLDTANDPVTTPTPVIFAIWNADVDGDSLWSEQRSVTPDDQGRFSILLGAVSPIPDSAFAGMETYLSVKVDTNPEMFPRQRFASVAYAYRDNDWFLINDVLFTQGEWGVARAGNVLYGDWDSTHINLGVACTTGTSGVNKNFATVGGGWLNAATQSWATVCGGDNNRATGGGAVISGGTANTASGGYSIIPGGLFNQATASHAVAIGSSAAANHKGAVVVTAYDGFPWDTIATGGDGQMVLRAIGGIYITNYKGSNEIAPYDPANIVTTFGGAYLSGNGTNWENASDRNLKENFQEIDRDRILEKVAQLPITKWNYRSEGRQIRHIGPVSQDFNPLFSVGNDDKSISTVDPAGVALAAIQGLYQQNQELKTQVEELEALVQKLLQDEK